MDTGAQQNFRQVIDFWFEGVSDGQPGEASLKRWFNSSEQFDREVAGRFGGLVRDLAGGEYRRWIEKPLSGLAAVIAMDQFPRNIFRGTAEAFSCDPIALESCLHLVEVGAEAELSPVQRIFLYMPLEHSEDIEMQEMSVRKFGQLADEAPADRKEAAMGSLDYAKLHRDLIARFGRFPHRNEVLGRKSTPEEVAYLAGGGETFGQTGSKKPG